MYLCAFGPSSSHSNYFVMFLIYSAFLYSLGDHICIQNCAVSLASGCWYVFVSSPYPSLVSRIFFRCFGMSCLVCIVLPFVDFSFIFHPVLSGLFIKLYCYFFLCFAFSLFVPSCSSVFVFFWWGLLFRTVFVDFLSAFPVEVSIQVLVFLCSFRGDPNFLTN